MHLSNYLQEMSESIKNMEEVERWEKVGKLGWDVKAQEHEIDNLMNLISKNELNEQYPLEYIDKSERIIKSIGNSQNLFLKRTKIIENLRNLIYDQQEIILELNKIQYFLTIHFCETSIDPSVSESEKLHDFSIKKNEIEQFCKLNEFKERIKFILSYSRKSLQFLQDKKFPFVSEEWNKFFDSLFPLSASSNEILILIKNISADLQSKLTDFDPSASASASSSFLDSIKSLLNSVFNSHLSSNSKIESLQVSGWFFLFPFLFFPPFPLPSPFLPPPFPFPLLPPFPRFPFFFSSSPFVFFPVPCFPFPSFFSLPLSSCSIPILPCRDTPLILPKCSGSNGGGATFL